MVRQTLEARAIEGKELVTKFQPAVSLRKTSSHNLRDVDARVPRLVGEGKEGRRVGMCQPTSVDNKGRTSCVTLPFPTHPNVVVLAAGDAKPKAFSLRLGKGNLQ